MRKSLGDKRREISAEHIQQIVGIASQFAEGEHFKIFDTTAFGYRKITIERPLRLNFQASPDRIERLSEQTAFVNLAVSKKQIEGVRMAEIAEGRKLQAKILDMLGTLPEERFTDRPSFESALNRAVKAAGLKLTPTIRNAILVALSERDETAEICYDVDGNPEPDPELRDTENVPLTEDVHAFFEREVAPHVPDAWVNTAIRDQRDGEIGKVGYEINFNRYFYQYEPPRPLAEIEAEIKTLEGGILKLLAEVTG